MAIEPYEIYRREITITGSMAVLHGFDRAGELMAAGILDPAVFVSHRFPLDSYAEALDQFRAGVGRKPSSSPDRPRRCRVSSGRTARSELTRGRATLMKVHRPCPAPRTRTAGRRRAGESAIAH